MYYAFQQKSLNLFDKQITSHMFYYDKIVCMKRYKMPVFVFFFKAIKYTSGSFSWNQITNWILCHSILIFINNKMFCHRKRKYVQIFGFRHRQFCGVCLRKTEKKTYPNIIPKNKTSLQNNIYDEVKSKSKKKHSRCKQKW